MNPETPREAKEIFLPVKRLALSLKRVTTVICPPAVFLEGLNRSLAPRLRSGRASYLMLGAQDCFGDTLGAYTGRLGPTMLKHSGADFVILGHSETRALGDTDLAINHKLRLALRHQLRVILCVGEAARDQNGDYLRVIRAEVEAALRNVQRRHAGQLVIAYEPLWAIGENASAADTPADFCHQAIYLRKVLAGLFGSEAARATPILYGGSVDARNAAPFLAERETGGLLVGRASLRPSEFNQILKLAENAPA